MTLVLGFGAAALLDTDEGDTGRRLRPATWPRRCSPRRSAAAPGTAGGAILLAFISAVAFATILAVVAGLTLDLGIVGGARPLRERHQEGRRPPRRTRSGWPGSPPSSSAASRSCWPSPRSASTSPSWWPWPSRSRRRQPAVAALQPVLEAVQHPRRDVGDLRRPDHLRRSGVLLAGRLRVRRPRCSRRPTGRGSRWRTRASSRSRPGSCSAGWAPSPSNEPAAEEAYPELEVRSLTGAGSEKAVQH